MKIVFTYLILLCSLLSISQDGNYQTYSASMTIFASKDGTDYQWTNKEILVNLNYKTGDFKLLLNKSDFLQKDSSANFNQKHNTANNHQFNFSGVFPIDQILNQKTTNKSYNIELQLENESFDFFTTVNFNMTVIRTSQKAGSYRVFTLDGSLNNDDLNLPEFEGYDNEISTRIIFNAFWNGE